MVGARQRLLTSLALKVENHCWIQSLHPNSERRTKTTRRYRVAVLTASKFGA